MVSDHYHSRPVKESIYTLKLNGQDVIDRLEMQCPSFPRLVHVFLGCSVHFDRNPETGDI